jgi:hypothetical protein
MTKLLLSAVACLSVGLEASNDRTPLDFQRLQGIECCSHQEDQEDSLTCRNQDVMKRCFDRESLRLSDSAVHKRTMLSLVAISESHNGQIPAADMLNWLGYSCCRKKDLAHSGSTCSTLSVLRACFQETEPTSQEFPAQHPEVVVNLAAEAQELEDDSNSLAASKARFLEQKTFFLHRKPKSETSKVQTSHQIEPTKQKTPEAPKAPKDVPAASKQQLASKAPKFREPTKQKTLEASKALKDVPAASKQQLASKAPKVSSLVQGQQSPAKTVEDGLTELLREEDSDKGSSASALAVKSPTGKLQQKNSTAVLLETEAKAFEQLLNGDESAGPARPQLAKEKKTSDMGKKNEKQNAHAISLAAWSGYFSKPENLANSPLNRDQLPAKESSAEEHQATVRTHSK